MINQFFDNEIQFLQGVGPKKARLLQTELKIENVHDLIFYFPYRYVDKTKIYAIAELQPDMAYVQIKAKVVRFATLAKNKVLSALVTDSSGSVELVWYKGHNWVKENLNVGDEYIFFGKPTEYKGKINISHPEIETPAENSALKMPFDPQYNTTEKMKKGYLTSKSLAKIIRTALKLYLSSLFETLPAHLISQHKLMPLRQTLATLHVPKDLHELKKAQFRIKWEELFYIQLKLLYNKNLSNMKTHGFVFGSVGRYFNDFYTTKLPFKLTNAQKRVVREIRQDMRTGRQMNRLLQGDVGSGKTLVALLAMLIALDNNFQTALMAPTEILAQQHFKSITELLGDSNVQTKILTGSTSQKERKVLHEKLKTGQIHILIGTHAILEEVVQFHNLGFVVIDEQHRFGVAQRAKMWQKNHRKPPHILVMTATPIPRTLSMTLYGDLDVSVIDELPPGRKPVKTYHVFDSQRLRVFKFMREQIAQGRQIYVVYPLINESENFDYKDLNDGLESITRAFPPPEYAVSVVHGQMKPAEKDKAMQLFAKGITNIMVATTVIEVGVNIPNASVMIIESADRFGLSQLHQLRGRVGRGADQAFCILMTSFKLSADGKKRLKTMVNTNDGFEIAEADLKLRGPGDMQGTQQSGIPFTLRMANLATDGQIIQQVRDTAIELLNDDPKLEKDINSVLMRELKRLNKDQKDWRRIS